MKILILKPSSLGDIVHALPVLRLLKLHDPASEIFWWVESGFAPLLEGDPDLTGIFQFQRRRWAAPVRWPEAWASLRGMRRQRFDVAIDLQGLARSAIFTWLAGAGINLGFENNHFGSREGARAAYDLVAPGSPAGTHAVDRYLSVLPLLGVPVDRQFEWLPQRPQIALQVREKWRTDSARWVTLLPGARWNNKRWPLDHFVELTRRLLALAPDLKVAILGSAADQNLGGTIAAAAPERCLDLTGRTTLPEMTEWLRLSQLTITNDTGPMHVAAALGRPVIALFGPTDPRRTGPYGQAGNVLQIAELPCVPCLRPVCAYREPLACLRHLTPDRVCAEAVSRMKL